VWVLVAGIYPAATGKDVDLIKLRGRVRCGGVTRMVVELDDLWHDRQDFRSHGRVKLREQSTCGDGCRDRSVTMKFSGKERPVSQSRWSLFLSIRRW